MIVVSDTTPLIALMKAGKLDLLKVLFGEVLIPEAVFEELTKNNTYIEESEEINNSEYIRIVKVEDANYVSTIKEIAGLDQGESEAIAYAKKVKADYLLMDEAKGRRTAHNMKIHIMGSLGVIVKAYYEDVISSDDVRTSVRKMKEANQYISDELINGILDLLNE